jgi:hypothetical protein
MKLRASAGRYARDLAQLQALATNVLPEVSTQFAGGSDLDLGRGLTAIATVYHTRRDQLAVDDPRMTTATTGNELAYESTGRGSSSGVDLMLRLSRDKLFGWIAYSYGKTSRRDRPGELSHATAFDQTHALTAVGSYQTGKWRFGARVSYASGLPYTDVVGSSYSEELGRYLPVLGSPYGVRYPDVTRIDLKVERAFKTKRVDLAAFIDFGNVFRQASVVRYQYNADFSERKPLSEYVPLPSLGIRGEI